MAFRTKRKVEVFVKGRWIETMAYINPEDICKGPNCNRKVPSTKVANYSRKNVPRKDYCSSACYHKDKKKRKLGSLKRVTEAYCD